MKKVEVKNLKNPCFECNAEVRYIGQKLTHGFKSPLSVSDGHEYTQVWVGELNPESFSVFVSSSGRISVKFQDENSYPVEVEHKKCEEETCEAVLKNGILTIVTKMI